MAKGAVAKEAIFAKILETFEGSFMYNSGKELRIPYDEGNGPIQIKVALTCAKDNVSPDGEILKVVEKSAATAEVPEGFMNFPEPKKAQEPSEEEKKNVEDLLKSLGL